MELDSHANMIVVEQHYFIIFQSGKVIDVGTIAYSCPWSHETHILIVWNALYVELMEENLIPPFTLREAGLIVNECPKQHCPQGEVTEDDHMIQDRGSGLKIAMDI